MYTENDAQSPGQLYSESPGALARSEVVKHHQSLRLQRQRDCLFLSVIQGWGFLANTVQTLLTGRLALDTKTIWDTATGLVGTCRQLTQYGRWRKDAVQFG